MLCHVCNVMSCYVMLCNVMSCYVMLCYVMLCHALHLVHMQEYIYASCLYILED